MENKININIDHVYEGPMDLLLSLIKENKIDIYDIPIAYITDEFIRKIGQINFDNLDSFLDFSLMASILLQIKSKMLLPKSPLEEDEEDPRKDLVERLIEYKQFKRIAAVLKNKNNFASKKILKKAEDLTILALEEKIDYKSVTANRLFSTYSKLLFKNTIKKRQVVFDIEEEQYTVEACIDLLSQRFESYKNFSFSNLFDDHSSKMEIVTYFLAILELMKLQKIKVKQKDNDIKIERIVNG